MQAVAPPAPRRVSYVLPLPSATPPTLHLPPPSTSRLGVSSPIYSISHSRPSTPSTSPRFISKDDHPRHRLPVQALAIDLSTRVDGAHSTPGGILYTGGRDGLVAAWELGLKTKKRKRRYGAGRTLAPGGAGAAGKGRRRSSPSDEFSDDEDDDEQELELELEEEEDQQDDDLPIEDEWEIEKQPGFVPPKAKFRQCLQSHTDWVNDIVLCDYNRTLVSASSDSLLAAWNPHSPNHEDQVTPKHIGRHGDYVRCLASPLSASWVASGGFDRKIKLWDIKEARALPIVELPSPPASIYSLACTGEGNLVAAGTPERVIRIWDSRSRKQVSRLAGHTDNIRAVLISDDGKTVLSASSDSTVKLWSLTSQKCLHTFSHHSTPVWSLFSQHPSLLRFYSGDKSGYICKIDLDGCSFEDPSQGECLVLARDGPEDSSDIRIGSEGITQIVGRDDEWIWSAGGSSSVKRWKDVEPRVRRGKGGLGGRKSDVATTASSKVEDDYFNSHRTVTPPPFHQNPQPDSSRSFHTPPTTNFDRERENNSSRPSLHSVSFLEDLTTTLSRTTSSPTPVVVRPASNSISGNSPFSSSSLTPPGRPSSLRNRPTQTSTVSPTSRRTTMESSNTTPITSSFTATPPPPPEGAGAETFFGIPYDSLVPLTSPDDTYFSAPQINTSYFNSRTKEKDIETATIYSTVSVLSVPLTYSRPNLSQPRQPPYNRPVSVAETTFEADTPMTTIARREFIERESATEATPLRSCPDDVIEGRVGLMRCELLSDKRHCLTIDSDDEILLWDLVEARCLGVFLKKDLEPFILEASSADSNTFSNNVDSRRPSDSSGGGNGGRNGNGGGNGNGEDLLEFVKERIDGEGSTLTWCKCDTRVGALTVHLEEGRVWDGEVYADEAHVGQDWPNDHRLLMGKWVLRHLFSNFIEAEVQLRGGGAGRWNPPTASLGGNRTGNTPEFVSLADLQSPLSSPPGSAKTPGMTIALATPAARKALLPPLPMPTSFASPRSALWDLTPIPSSPLGTPKLQSEFNSGNITPTGMKTPTDAGGGNKEDYFSLPPSSNSETPMLSPGSKALDHSSRATAAVTSPSLPTPGGTLMGRLRLLGKGSKRTTATDAAVASTPEAIGNGGVRTVEEAQQQQHRIMEAVLSHPITPCTPFDAPPLHFDPHMAVLISEETEDAAAWAVTYRGLVGTGREDLHVLEQKSPLWLMDFLLRNQVVIKDPVKISFIIQPWIDIVRARLPELPNSNARLTAARSLRMRKVMAYVADRLNLRDSSAARSRAASISGSSLTGSSGASVHGDPIEGTVSNLPSFVPEQELEILCGNILLHSRMTLATVRTYHWKMGGDVVLSYRMKVLPHR